MKHRYPSLSFEDGQRAIDMVMVSRRDLLEHSPKGHLLVEQRKIFEENLLSIGLELELANGVSDVCLAHQARVLQLRLIQLLLSYSFH